MARGGVLQAVFPEAAAPTHHKTGESSYGREPTIRGGEHGGSRPHDVGAILRVSLACL